MKKLLHWVSSLSFRSVSLTTGLLVCLVVLGFIRPVQAQTDAPTPNPTQTGTPTPVPTQTGPPTPVPTPLTDIPPDFRMIDAALGVQIFRKDYANGSPDFVQVIDLSQGARIDLLHGQITEARPTKGSFGGPDPRMTSPALETYWQQVSSQDPYAFCVTNGTFFYMPEYPTRLAFPLKADGQLLTEGWGIDTYVDQHLILELWQEKADIQELSEQALYASDAPDILGGLTELANKRAKFAVGRTFLGLDDRDGDGQQETVLILNTQTALQSGAAAVLRDFGADQVMMLDGGGSTQLLCRSGWHIRSDRPIPQALAIFAAKPPPVAMQVLRQPDWPVLVQGEAFPFEMEIQNSGVVSWTQQATQFELNPGDLGIARWLPVKATIQPGERAVFTDTLATLYQPGLYNLQIDWAVIHEDKAYPGKAFKTHAVVLPEALAGQRGELEKALQSWKSAPPDQVQMQVEAWLEEHAKTVLPTVEKVTTEPPTSVDEEIRPWDAILVPLLMLPIVLLVGFILARKNAD